MRKRYIIVKSDDAGDRFAWDGKAWQFMRPQGESKSYSSIAAAKADCDRHKLWSENPMYLAVGETCAYDFPRENRP